MYKVLIWTFWTKTIEDSQPPNWVEYAHDLETAEMLATERPRADYFEIWYQGVRVNRGKRNKYGYWSIETEEQVS